jgi:mRNA interferase MazF
LILCQITSRPYSSKTAIKIEASDFEKGNLPLISYIRPDKLFTADTSIIKNTAGVLTKKTQKRILEKVRNLFVLP